MLDVCSFLFRDSTIYKDIDPYIADEETDFVK